MRQALHNCAGLPYLAAYAASAATHTGNPGTGPYALYLNKKYFITENKIV